MSAVLALATLITVPVVIVLLAPFMRGTPAQKATGWFMLCAITLGSMAFYLKTGSPALPSEPAQFQTSGAAFERREAVRQELALSEQLVRTPDDQALLFELGSLRLKNGRITPAIAVLERAFAADPHSSEIRTKLGAAHYAAAIEESVNANDRAVVRAHFERALEIAPDDAIYRERLSSDFKTFQDED